MKILIVSPGKIPSQRANIINTIKHAQAFYHLNHQVKIYSIKRLYEDLLKFQIKDINKFYNISSKVKIELIRDKSVFYFKDILPHIFKSLDKQTKKVTSSKGANNKEKIRNEISYLKYIFQKIKTNFYKINYFDIEKKISTYCKDKNFDLCYTRAYKTVYYNVYNKIPTILECHEANLWKPKMQYVIKSCKSKYFICVVTISNVLKNLFIKAGIPKEKILVLEDAVELKKYDTIKKTKLELRELLNLPKKKTIIMYTGSLFEGRGIDTLLDAVSILDDSNLICYFLGGNNKEIRRWEKYRAQKNNQINVNFLGFIQNSKIPFYHKAADILVAPYSLKCNNIQWMSPIKLFEYMASKIPIITSNVKRIKQICNNGECLFFKESYPLDLVKKIKKLLNNKDLGLNLSERAYQTVKNYTYEKRCQEIISFFKNTWKNNSST